MDSINFKQISDLIKQLFFCRKGNAFFIAGILWLLQLYDWPRITKVLSWDVNVESPQPSVAVYKAFKQNYIIRQIFSFNEKP